MESTPWDPEGVTVVLDPQGRIVADAHLRDVDVKRYYKLLVAARCLDLRLGRAALPMWASAAGEEAAIVATALAARDADWIYPGLRDAAVALARGVAYDDLASALIGSSNGAAGAGLSGRIAIARHRIGTTTDALGMHLAVACGQAHGQKLLRDGGITFALFGEGLTTTGTFHETAMTAVACDLPLVLVCRSQVWPDGAPAEAGLVGDAVADRAKGSGLWVRRVDGADPLGVLSAVSGAADRARDGRGPALVEVVVTQLGRDPPAHRDPIERMRRHLDASGLWTQTWEDVIEAEVRGQLDRAFAHAKEGARA